MHECLDDENNETAKVENKPVPGYRHRKRSGDSVNSQNFACSKNSNRLSNVSDSGKVNRSIIEQVEEAVIESITVSNKNMAKCNIFDKCILQLPR